MKSSKSHLSSVSSNDNHNLKRSLIFNTIRQTDYNQRKNGSSLEFNKTLSKVTQSFKKVPWSFASGDQFLRDGFSVILSNKKTQGYLVTDIGTRALGPDEAYIPTVTPNHPGPVTRSVFVIRKVDKADMFGSDNIIRYG